MRQRFIVLRRGGRVIFFVNLTPFLPSYFNLRFLKSSFCSPVRSDFRGSRSFLTHTQVGIVTLHIVWIRSLKVAGSTGNPSTIHHLASQKRWRARERVSWKLARYSSVFAGFRASRGPKKTFIHLAHAVARATSFLPVCFFSSSFWAFSSFPQRARIPYLPSLQFLFATR